MEFEGWGLFFSELTKFNVMDFNDKKMGHIGDLLIDKQIFTVKGLIIYGSYLDQKLESIGLKEHIDPIIPIVFVDYSRFRERVVASVKAKHQLPTSKDYTVPEEVQHYQLSKNIKYLMREITQ